MSGELILQNLCSPIVLAFVLGAIATLVRSDLKIPEQIYSALSVYLLLAIGLKGGVELSNTSFSQVAWPMLGTLALGVLIPLVAFAVLRRKFDRANAAAIAAHYGSVSAVTYMAAVAFATRAGDNPEGFMPALVAILEVPAIIIALLLARKQGSRDLGPALAEIVSGKSVILLVGGLIMGLAAGEKGFAPVAPVFKGAFSGLLVIFLLEMGMVAARRFGDVKRVGGFLVTFAILAPIAQGALGVLVGHWCGLGPGGCTILGAMAASASYIAAPAAVRVGIPEANPSLSLTAALGITFPFNLSLGLPLYHLMAVALSQRS
ncbi:MAG: sodium-dependent bicarbonate transport family permease [Chthonomonas sp.]|nr:sodium-dependent bicarbonate transport family permease [Chthonomonas sp.]